MVGFVFISISCPQFGSGLRFMVFNATFNNISVILLLSVLLSPDASSKGTIEMGVVHPCAWFPDDNL